MRESITYGYARVSARDQNLARQLDALEAFGVDSGRVYSDMASGKDFNRPAWRRLMRALREGDVLVVKSIDRLGRNYEEILDVWRLVTKQKGVAVVVLDMPLLDTRESEGDLTGTFLADVVLQLLSYIAQVERENTHQRQAEGIAAARARGVRFGRPRIERPPSYEEIKSAYLFGRIKRTEAARRLNVGVSTFGRWLREDEAVVGKRVR